MKLIALVVTGILAIAGFTWWSDHQRDTRRSALEERAKSQRRTADSLAAAAKAARRPADSLGALLTRDIPRVRVLIRKDTVPWLEEPGTVVIHTTTLLAADTALARGDELVRASSLALETSENRAQSLANLAATNRALYLNEKRRARFGKGIQFGAGACVSPSSTTPTACGYVGYGFQWKVP